MTDRFMVTGASGRLSRELRNLRPDWLFAGRPEFDLTDVQKIRATLDEFAPTAVIHAAAYTDVAGAEKDHESCWRINVEGTQNLIRELFYRSIFLIHISTDYVFEGSEGMYREEDPPGPVCNYYALTKLAAEAAARSLPGHLIIRTSFRSREWPYPVAFQDVFTSQDYVDALAPDIALAAERYKEIPFDTIHIATERKSAYELAKRRKPDVRAGRRAEASVSLPADISLDISRWLSLKRTWRQD